MSKKVKKLPDVYYIAPNGMKLKMFGKNSVFKSFPLESSNFNMTIHEPRLNVALTDELNAKGSINVTFKYGDFKCDEVSK